MVQTVSRTEGSPRVSFRGDIEGLRALAIILVLVGHAGTRFLPGGFVGVDVFFVISGFLITGLLVGELDRTGKISLVGFYARRAKRLLPAAGLVLLAALLLTWLLLPRVRFAETAWDVVGGALYVLNWRLAAQAGEYLATDQAPSVVQHYWSLSVEEQFYLLWPLLLVGLAALARRTGRPQATGALLLGGVLTLGVASLAWSVYRSGTDPAAGYFVSTTRIWELALGGVVALLATRLHRTPRPVAAGLAWTGLAAVLLAGVVIREATGFPGAAALLPTLGTAAVLAFAVAAGRAGPAGLLGVGPMRTLGALSYSLYLWHWPLLVVAEHRFGTLGVPASLAVVALSAVPAYLTHRFVENPVRRSWTLQWEPTQALQVGAACTSVAVAAGLLFHFTVWPPAQPTPPAVALPSAGPTGGGAAPGAGILPVAARGHRAGAPVDRVGSIVPDPLAAHADVPEATRTGCQVDQATSRPRSCGYGDPGAPVTLVLAGDSHATQWLPALEEVATRRGWRVVAYTKASCPFLTQPVASRGRAYDTCTEWNRRVRAELRADPPDLLLVGNSRYQPVHRGEVVTGADRAQTLLAEGLRGTWRQLTRLGVPVVVLRDTPYHERNPVECVSAHPERLTRCAPDRAEVLANGGGPVQERAAQGQSGVHLVDLNDAVCPTDRCAPVIGGVLVYRDTNHLTATYARSLAPRLEKALTEVREGRES